MVGEYGIESTLCRQVCLLIFVMGVFSEVTQIFNVLYLLIMVPSKDSAWIDYHDEDAHEGNSQIDLIKFKVNGMPIIWKLFNFLFLVVPRAILFYAVMRAGVFFLMETAEIVDTILNTLALTFIMDLDELIMDRLSSAGTKHVMQNIEDYVAFDYKVKKHRGDPHHADPLSGSDEDSNEAFPVIESALASTLFHILKLAAMFGVAQLFRNNYLKDWCHEAPNGSSISNPVETPSEVRINPFAIFSWDLSKAVGGFDPLGSGGAWSQPGES